MTSIRANPTSVTQEGHLYDDAKLLESLAEDSEWAFAALFNRYHSKVYRLAIKFLKSSALAEGTVQEVFLKIWLKRAELGEIHNFDSYLFMVAKNTTLDAFRKLSVRAVAEGAYAATRVTADDSTDRSMLEDQYQEMVQQAVTLLPAQQAKVFQMAKIEGLSHEAIAKQMSISKFTVKKHMANALQFIRQRLQRSLVALLPLLPGIFDL